MTVGAESKVLWHVTMSLDGFIEGPSESMDWAFAYRDPNPLGEQVMRGTGAILAGRRWFDVATRHYNGRKGIYGGAWSGPVFVLTHDPPPSSQDQGITFVTDGIGAAVRTARAAAGERDLEIFGANVAKQCLQQQLINEIVVHVAPVLLGNGVRLYAGDDAGIVKLERYLTTASEHLTSMRFRVLYAPSIEDTSRSSM